MPVTPVPYVVCPHIVIIGNVANGLTFYGPFESNETAMDWAEKNFPDWLIARVEDPNSEDFK